MALGHVTSDHDLVSSHKLTRSGLSHKQRGNLWGKQQELWEEGEQADFSVSGQNVFGHYDLFSLCPL